MNQSDFWKQLKFVTGNLNKLREAQEILGLDLEVVSIDNLQEIQTYDVEEIVFHKAKSAWEKLKCPVLVEDSGLIFKAWNGLPGALVKWFEKSVGCQGMLKMLHSFEDRSALALCLVAIYDGKDFKVGKGEVNGSIAPQIKGTQGFGWDVIFIPEGSKKTYAEMNPEEKNAISHRRRAFENLKLSI